MALFGYDVPWGLVLLSGFIIGMVVTGGALVAKVAREARRAETRVCSGDIDWWSHVRERRSIGWGLSGELYLNTDDQLVLLPDSASLRRGARPQTWPIDQIYLSFGPRKRDITGVSYAMLAIRPKDHGQVRHFGCFKQRGYLHTQPG